MITSDRDIYQQVTEALDPYARDFDIEGIVRQIIADHGLVSIEDIDGDVFWTIVKGHDLAGQAYSATTTVAELTAARDQKRAERDAIFSRLHREHGWTKYRIMKASGLSEAHIGRIIRRIG
jgi:hypothetical protein